MSTVLVIEDQFLTSYDLECALKERGFDVRHAATEEHALAQYTSLRLGRSLAAIVCDDRLIDNKPAAKVLYSAIRARDAETPFVVYSGFPPDDLPPNDPRLAIVRKPFVKQVLAQIETFAPPFGQGEMHAGPPRHREAA